ncbi:MAG: hypothetical protein MJ095_08680, partial [Oscillospiraceae bacterium]|nr:hypothetical protein [Oscillospiraceae bacterium]
MENKRISVMRKTAAILALAIAANSAIYAGAEKPVFTDPDGITVQEEQKAVVSDLKEFLDAIAMGKKEITVTKMLGEVNNAALKNYPAFSDGVIDCNGCVIHISAPLFKAVNHGFTFKNATVTGSAEITAENEGNVGAVCLFNRGTISQVFVTADVKGGKNDYVSAGIVCGHNDGTVYQCLVKGSVKTDGGNHIGGVCGFNNGAVRECSASAEIICDSSNSGAVYGGICGMSNNKVSDCLFEGTFAGNPASGKEVGGICGKFHGSDWAENCMYYDRSGVPVFTTMTNGTSSFDVYTLGNGAGSWYNGYKNNNNVNYGTVENIQDFTNGVILEKLADNRADVWVQGEKYPVLWFGYTPEPDEPEEPEVTTTEPETTTSKVTTTEPAVTTTTPKETTTEPETTTSSKVTTTEPAVTTTTPKETTTEPETT